jgi:predicted nucleotide-binding protein
MANNKRAIGRRKLTDRFSERDYLDKLLKDIKDLSDNPSLEIRFYDVLTEAPIYIFSQFIGKGLILYDQTAAHNPWLMFVDDITQKDDLYDYLSDNFDAIWQDESASVTNPQPTRPLISAPDAIFISHGRNEAVTLKIRNFLKEQLGKTPILFEEMARPGLTIVENLEVITRQCSRAIILMTKEDEQKDGGLRARQNVIHELGYCQSLYGRDRVVLLMEKGVELPSNISGILYTQFAETSVEMCFEFLRKHLK